MGSKTRKHYERKKTNFIKSSSPSFLSEIKYLLKDKYPSLRGMLMRKSEPPIVAHLYKKLWWATISHIFSSSTEIP